MIRPYLPKDRAKVIGLLRLNTPTYFAPAEEEDLKTYLDKELEDYFVFEADGKILGAGGINYFPKERLARIAWDMVHPETHGQGIGKQLVEHRIRHLNKKSNFDSIFVRTSQLAYKFYTKMGFKLEKIEKDYWAKDFDLYEMQRKNQ